ncbi:hypothetical protein AAFF_G00161720 [Aldrovandia affinis]|uniref:non-specific serine/threonine protein kinase n=1 Tax=Aldrovandia affinis TaxID=143900 RepID=A0AAD7RMW1_9TELE|nr:hypothetical protein AAFF_G00161720 [Aldrovandia affinis]
MGIFSSKRREQDVEKYYKKEALLGQGGFGCVYAGIRISDGLPVALKYVTRSCGNALLIPGEKFCVPSEVGLTALVNQQGGHPNVIRMHEWFQASDHYVMVLERPDPCLDLSGWTLLSQNRALDEAQAQPVIEQLLQALIHCQKHGVFHRDVKPGNILINTDTLRVILIDFGCGDVWKDTQFYDFAGTQMFMAPQWHLDHQYLAGPATVWSVGVTLYAIVSGCLPFQTIDEVCMRSFTFPGTLSPEIRDFINQCLAFEEEERPTLQELLLHPWLRSVCLQTASERSSGDERGVKWDSCVEEQEIPVKRSWKVSERSTGDERGVKWESCVEDQEIPVKRSWKVSERSTGDERGVKWESCVEDQEIPVKRSWKGSNEGRLHEGLPLPVSLFPGSQQGHTGDQLQQYGPQERRGVKRKRGRDEEQALLGLSSTSDRPAECSQQASERRTVKRKRGCVKDEEQALMHSEYLGLSSTSARPAECFRQGSNEGRLHEGLPLPVPLFPGSQQDHTGDQLQQYGRQERRGVRRKRGRDKEQALIHCKNLGLSSTRTRPAKCSQQGPEPSSHQAAEPAEIQPYFPTLPPTLPALT